MSKLVSERLPNDGTYHIKRLVDEANARLKQIGRQGKRATIVAKKSSLTLQFTFKDGNGRPQKNVGLGAIPVSTNGILEAENIARMVTTRLVAGKFTWNWFNETIGKDTSEQAKQLTCREMVEQYKKHYFRQRANNKTPKSSWYNECRHLEKILSEPERSLSLNTIRVIVDLSKNNSRCRKRLLNGLVGFLKYFGNNEYKKVIAEYKKNNVVTAKSRNVPSTKQIIGIFNNGFVPKPRTPKKHLHVYPQWQFLFGLLATYGLRIHEAWNIANWDEPVTLKDGDWVTVDIDDDNSIETQRSGGDLIIPAILDPNNKEFILCIKHATKTGYRMAMPLSPEGHNWIEEFNLLQPFNVPYFDDPLGRKGNNEGSYYCSSYACRWFARHEYNFTPHDLRHAYTIRGHQLGCNPKALADSAGHSLTISSTTYLRHMSDNDKLEGMKDAISKEQNKRSENELLKGEIVALKSENKDLKAEIELLKTKLQLNKTIQES